MLRTRAGGKRPGFGLILLEVVLIVMGVLLGLAANNWREAQLETQRADQALEHIAGEIVRNLDQVQSILPYHMMIRDSLNELRDQIAFNGKDVTVLEFYAAVPKGFSTIVLESTGWKLALQTGTISHMEYRYATMLSKLYDLQDFMQGKLDYIPENLYVTRNSNPLNLNGTVATFAILINDIVILEKDLVDGYRSVLEMLPGDHEVPAALADSTETED